MALSAAFSPDGRLILTGGPDGAAKFWPAAATVPPLRRIPTGGSINGLAVSPGNGMLLTGQRWDGIVQLWDLRSGRLLADLTGHTKAVDTVCFSPGGQRAATASRDGTARVWDLDGRRELLCLRGHTDEVRAVAFSPDGRRLLTASRDMTAKLWDSETGREVLSFQEEGWVEAAVFSPDGRGVLVRGAFPDTIVRDALPWESTREGIEQGKRERYAHWLKENPPGE